MAEEILMNWQLGRDRIPRGLVNTPVNMVLRMETSDAFARQHPKTFCDIILAVDTSGSMDEDFGTGGELSKREAVIQAAEAMLDGLDPQDTVSLVCFDSDACEELSGVPAGDRRRVASGLARIREHNGNTNFEAAFAVCRRLLDRLGNPSKKVVFLTDGNANVGDMKKARRTNEELARAGVVVDCYGVGTDYNHQLMREFVSVSNGEAHKLAAPRDAQRLFKASVKNAQQSLIANAVLRVEVPEKMRDVEFYQTTPQQHHVSAPEGVAGGMRIYKVNLSAMTQSHIYNFVLHFSADTPATADMQNMLAGRAVLEYDVPVRGLRTQRAVCVKHLTLGDSPAGEQRRSEVDDMYVTATLIRLEDKKQAAAQKGDWKAVADAVPSVPDPLFGAEVGLTYRAMRAQLLADAAPAH